MYTLNIIKTLRKMSETLSLKTIINKLDFLKKVAILQ